MLPAGSHLARGELEALLGERRPYSPARRSEVVVARLDELAAALEARAVGHGARPDAAADALARLEDRDVDARAREIDGAGEAGEAGADHRDAHRLRRAERSRLSRTSSSAICTAFVARALAQVVGDDPERERVRVAEIAADAPDEDAVLAVGVDRHRIGVGGRVVDAR